MRAQLLLKNHTGMSKIRLELDKHSSSAMTNQVLIPGWHLDTANYDLIACRFLIRRTMLKLGS